MGELRHLTPVVAMPRSSQRWPKRNTRKSGSRETTDIANIPPKSEADWASTKVFRASGAVWLLSLVR